MLPPIAKKKMQGWIRSRHLICSGNIFIFETFDCATIEKFEECITSLGGKLICVNASKKVWRGSHRRVILYQARAKLDVNNHSLKQYWYEKGSFYTRFDDSC